MVIKMEQTFLYQKITRYLAELISEHMGETNYKLPTEIEVAESQKVSRITSRKAFKELDDLHLIYRIKGNGTYIREDVTKEMLSPFIQNGTEKSFRKVAAILPLYNSQHVMEIIAAIMQASSDMKLLIASSDMSVEREQQLIKDYLEMQVDGLIIYPIDNDIYNPLLINLAATNFPVVMVDRYLPGLNFGYVSSDHKTMSALAVQHLVERGHKHILFFNANINSKTNTTLATRQESYINALSEFNNYNTYFFTFDGISDPTSESFCEKFRQYLNSNPGITAIITADYASGLHLIQMFKLLDLDYPKDYEVVFLDFKTPQGSLGTDNSLPTYIEQNSFQLGFDAVQMLRDALSGKTVRYTHKITPVNLVQGRSTSRS
jgi:GntR family transcriptional regulator of arabinose operon